MEGVASPAVVSAVVAPPAVALPAVGNLILNELLTMTDFLASYNILGLTIGICTFLIIGIFHPIVIKGHYHFGVGCRWWFALIGIIALVATILVKDVFWSSLLGVFAFSSFWSILEIKQQEERVRKGWFPANPKHRKPTP